MKKKFTILALCMASISMFAQEIKELKTDKDELSYAVGLSIGEGLKQEGISVDLDLSTLTLALSTAIKGEPALMPIDSINSVITRYMAQKAQKIETLRLEQAQKNKEEADKFFEENKKKKGIKVTDTGLQYEVLTKSKSKDMPTLNDLVKVKYEGRLLNGKVFDSTDKNNNGLPIEFPLKQVIKAWQQGLVLMNKGAKYRFYVPADLAYGENGAGKDIGPNQALIFDVELIDFAPNKNVETQVQNQAVAK